MRALVTGVPDGGHQARPGTEVDRDDVGTAGADGRRIAVIGVTQLLDAQAVVPLTRAERSILAVLVLQPAGASVQRLHAVLWPDGGPATARQSLHNHVHRLRRKLAPIELAHAGGVYQLHPRPTVDIDLAAEATAAGRAALEGGHARAAIQHLRGALGHLIDRPFADLTGDPMADAESVRIEHRRDEVEDLLAHALVAAGEGGDAVCELERLVALEPGREVRWIQLLRAMVAVGRRTDALDAYHRARRALLEVNGLEPGDELRSIQRALLQPGTVHRPALSGPASTVGREATAMALCERLTRCRTVVLTGEEGIGKSAVLSVIGQRWSGPVIAIDCGTNPWHALGPVEDLLGLLSLRLRRLALPTTLDVLCDPGAAVPRTGDGRGATPLIHRVAGVLVAGLTAEVGTLLVIDDVHRAGPMTRAILAEVAKAAHGTSVLMTSRPDEDPPPGLSHDDEVVLGGLDPAGLAELAEMVARRPAGVVPPAMQRTSSMTGGIGRWLHDLTDGHPQLTIEVLDALTDPSSWAWVDGTPIPPRLQEVLRRRIETLPPPSRRALDAAAVMGEVLDLDVLGMVVGLDLLTPAIRNGILRQEDEEGLRFAHGLLQRVAGDVVPLGRRIELHHAIGLCSHDPAARHVHLNAAAALDRGLVQRAG